MKTLITLALILTCFVFTTLMVGCSPAKINKRQRIQKERGLVRKAIPQLPNKQIDEQIDEFLSTINKESRFYTTLEQIPQGTFELTQIVSTINNPDNGFRVLLSAKVSADNHNSNNNSPLNPTLTKEKVLIKNKNSAANKNSTISSSLALPYQVQIERDFKVTLNQNLHYSMEIQEGNIDNFFIHNSPPATLVQPLSLLKREFEDSTKKVFVGTDGVEKGLKIYVRLTNKEEILLVVDMPTDSSLVRSFILIYEQAAND